MRFIEKWVCLGILASLAVGGFASNAESAWVNSLKPQGPAGPVLTLASNGATKYVVVISKAATTQEKKAAEDLAQWLHEMTGATFPIVSDASDPVPTEISVGQTNRLDRVKLTGVGNDLGDEGYAIAAQDQRLFLIGGRTRGPINAVYALLEEDLGCRWYAGSEARIPKQATLQFSPIVRTFVPKLRIRDPFYSDAFDATWSLRNRTNAPLAPVPEAFGGHLNYAGFVHTYARLVPADKYWESHPEYYSMIDGKRGTRQLCETNADVARIITEGIVHLIEQNPHCEFLSISANDGGGHCECPTCQKMIEENGSPAAPLLCLLNRVGEAIEKDHPNVLLSTLAYLDTVDPPKVIRPRKNVAIRLCDDLHSWDYPFTCFADDDHPESKRYRDAVVGWGKICDNLYIWDYFVNFSHYLAPMPNMHLLKPSVDYYLANNVKGIMFQAGGQGPCERARMRSWVMAKLLWDPSRNVETLTEDFVRGYYEEAAEPILKYYDLLEHARVQNMDTLTKPVGGEQRVDADGACLDVGGIRFHMNTPFLSRELLNQASALFDQAESLARSDEMRRRIQCERLPILYVKLQQGPTVWGDEYAKLIDEFSTIAHREHVTHLREGAPDLDRKIEGWRASLKKKE